MAKHPCPFFWLILIVLSSCHNEIDNKLDRIEAMLDVRPADALAAFDDVDSTSLGTVRGMRYDLLYAIALDKNHVDDGRRVKDMARVADWYDRYGSRKDRLKARYYYGDQLRGAGELEDAAVQFMRSEHEAVFQKDWFLAGMSARSLYYVFAKTHNYPEELSSIERALEYFRLAGKEVHEDDARIKLALAFYDNSELTKADSVYRSAIRIATDKKDSLRLRIALSNSADVFLVDEPYRPDSVISRLTRAEALGYKPNSRALATYSLSKALLHEDDSDEYLKAAYSRSRTPAEKAFVMNRDYQIQLSEGNQEKAFPLLRELYDYVDSVAIVSLEESVVKAQNGYLKTTNELLRKQKAVNRIVYTLILLLVFAVSIVAWLLYKRSIERRRMAEEEMKLETDRYRLACEELGSLGFESMDRISAAYYYPSSQIKTAMLEAYESEIEKFRSEEFQNKLLDNLDKKYDGLIIKLKEQMPSLTRNRIMLFAYLVLGLSYTSIKVIMGSRSRQNVYDMRWQLISAIKKANPEDRDLFLSFLPSHPTRS